MPMEALHSDLARAITLLELQEQLIGSLSAELAATRVERDQAREIRGLIEALLQQRHEGRTCRCGQFFLPKGRGARVCQDCRIAHAKKAAAASRAAALRRAGQETPAS
jgi:hypothetical protein